MGHAPQKIVLKSGFMGREVVESRGFVKVGVLPIRGMPRMGRNGGQIDKSALLRTNLPCRECSCIRANVVVHDRIHAVVGKGVAGKELNNPFNVGR